MASIAVTPDAMGVTQEPVAGADAFTVQKAFHCLHHIDAVFNGKGVCHLFALKPQTLTNRILRLLGSTAPEWTCVEVLCEGGTQDEYGDGCSTGWYWAD